MIEHRMQLNKRTIVIVAGMHGNERMPGLALADAGVEFILGNPRAYKKNVRFTEKDLNASFGTRRKDFESRRAAEILRKIGADAVVVDFHTSSEKIPFVIVVDKKMIPLARRTGLRRVVLMRHNIKRGHALINHRDGISIEAGAHQDLASIKNTLRIIEALGENTLHPVTVYEVFDQIVRPGTYINFKQHPDGFIPVLANEPEYEKEGIFGLKARILS